MKPQPAVQEKQATTLIAQMCPYVRHVLETTRLLGAGDQNTAALGNGISAPLRKGTPLIAQLVHPSRGWWVNREIGKNETAALLAAQEYLTP
eukprot:586289-Rhodomonas_salina.4